MGNRQTKSQQNRNASIRVKEANTATLVKTEKDVKSAVVLGEANKTSESSVSNAKSKDVISLNSNSNNLQNNSNIVNTSNNVNGNLNNNASSQENFFGWPALKGFKDLKDERLRFQLSKNDLDKSNDLDVNKIIGGIAETSKREDRQISKEKRLDDKRLHKIAEGREQINNQDSLGENLSRLSQDNSSISTERNVVKGENQDSIASAHNGDEPKLSRRAKARANRANEQSDEQGVLHAVEGKEVNGQSSEVVQGAVPQSYPFDKNSVDSNLQLAKVESSDLLDADGNKLPSDVSEQSSVMVEASDTPASEGKGSLDSIGKQIGTAEGKGMQSLSIVNDRNVIKNASKGFLVLFSEKTDEILSPLSFVAHNHVKMGMAIIQLFVPVFLAYLLINNVQFINSGISNSNIAIKILLYAIFYIGCLCASIFIQVLGSGFKGMFIKAFIDAASIGENKK